MCAKFFASQKNPVTVSRCQFSRVNRHGWYRFKFAVRDHRHRQCRSRFDGAWLRYSCECDSCGTCLSTIRRLRLVDISDDIRVASVRLTYEGMVEMIWSNDGHVCLFDPVWLRSRCGSTVERRHRRWKPVLWDNDLEGRPPKRTTVPASRTRQSTSACWKHFVRGVPADPDHTEAIASLAGPLRITNYGKIYQFSIRAGRPGFRRPQREARSPHG